MALVRTFYWVPTRPSPLRRVLRRGTTWKTGNAGDLLNPVLIEETYGLSAQNVEDDGRRLLLVGSVAHRVRNGDLVVGIGSKGAPVPSADTVRCTVLGTRGPITTQAFRRAGHDLSGLQFELDPGLLVGRMLGTVPSAVPGRVAYVPHYRDPVIPEARHLHRLSVDTDPFSLTREIARAEFVYTSSLHGLVFAHAVGRPARLVAPESAEPIIKYEDYFASLGLPWREPVRLAEALREPTPDSPVDLPPELATLELPTLDQLRAAGVTE